MGIKIPLAANEVLIQYIGSQPRKDDNVLDSGRVWERPGAAIPVPAKEKYHYLKYPAVFREVTEDQLAAEDTTQRDLVQQVVASLSSIELEGLREIELALKVQIEQAQAELQKLNEIPSPPAPENPEPLTAENASKADDVGTFTATAARETKILQVLRDLDPDAEPEAFRPDGKTPLIDVIRTRSGYADLAFTEMMDLLATLKT